LPHLSTLLRDLTHEVDRLVGQNALLENRLQAISGALGTARGGVVRGRRAPSGRTGGTGRRGAPAKFSDEQASQLRKEYERGASSAELAKKYRAALPTILSTLRRAGAALRRGRRSKSLARTAKAARK
jgi:hypothetical protein